MFVIAQKELEGSPKGKQKTQHKRWIKQRRDVLARSWLPNLLRLPEGENIGKAINDAKKAIS